MKPSELKERLDKGEEVLMLDVREKDEAAEAGDILPGATNVPMGEVFIEAAKGSLPKDKKIVTICKTGGRCQIIAEELNAKGFDIEYLEGGMEAWHKEGN